VEAGKRRPRSIRLASSTSLPSSLSHRFQRSGPGLMATEGVIAIARGSALQSTLAPSLRASTWGWKVPGRAHNETEPFKIAESAFHRGGR
jgi:hypothetical protein